MTNVQMAIFTLMCAALSVVANLIQGVALEPTLIGIAVLLAIVFGGVVIYKLIYKLTGWKGLPTVAYICTLGTIVTIPDFLPCAAFVGKYAGKVSFLGLCTPILAYAGLAVGKDMEMFKKLGWKIVVVGLFVFVGTFVGSAVIAELVLRSMVK